MARTPSFYKPQMTSEAFIRHFTAVADASPVPYLYNVTMYTVASTRCPTRWRS